MEKVIDVDSSEGTNNNRHGYEIKSALLDFKNEGNEKNEGKTRLVPSSGQASSKFQVNAGKKRQRVHTLKIPELDFDLYELPTETKDGSLPLNYGQLDSGSDSPRMFHLSYNQESEYNNFGSKNKFSPLKRPRRPQSARPARQVASPASRRPLLSAREASTFPSSISTSKGKNKNSRVENMGAYIEASKEDEYLFAKEALSRLKTGDDAISFFALHGSNTPLKFVHLNRAPQGKRFRPYDVVVVAPNEVEPEHFTMSATGVVRIAPDEPSDFVPLVEWMRLSTIFNVISSIRFFKHYLVFKVFRTWQTNVRYNVYRVQRKKLASKLFLAKRSFCGPLLIITRSVAEMHNATLLCLRSQKTYEATHFGEYQAQMRAEATKELEGTMEKVQAVVEKVCNDATKRARVTAETFRNHGGSGFGTPRELKTKSLVLLKQEHEERVQKLKLATQEADMLGDFIRLVDYMTVENLVLLCVSTHQNFLTELLKTTRKSGMFETTVKFSPQKLQFLPTESDIVNLADTISQAMISSVSSVPRIVYIRPFKDLVSPLIGDSPDVRNFVLKSKAFVHTTKQIKKKIIEDFSEAQEYAKAFDKVRPIYDYNRSFDFEKYKKEKHTIVSIKRDMSILSGWVKDLEKMRVGNTVGILYVESRKLRSSLNPITERGLTRMKGILEELARKECSKLVDEYKTMIRSLEAQPNHLKEFASHVKNVSQLKVDTKAMGKSSAVVEEMYRLCSSYGMKISSVDSVQFDDLRTYTESFASKRREAEAFIESKMPEMTQNLDMNIAKLGDQLVQIRQVVESGVFVDPTSDPDVVLQEYETAKTKLDMLDDLSKAYSTYQELFGITKYDYKNLRDVRSIFDLCHDCWSSLKLWNQKYSEWHSVDMIKLDVESLSKDVQKLYKSTHKVNKELNNPVTNMFLEKLKVFKSKVPVIMELGNPCMKPRHWKRLFKALHQPWFPSGSFTLQNLSDYRVYDFDETVTDISACASGEAQLEASLESIKNVWANQKFELLKYKEKPSNVYILSGMADVFTLLEDNQVTLQTMMGSRFIDGVQRDVELWRKKLSLLNDTLDEWVTCQKNWMYLETIFSADDIQEQLPNEASKFRQVDKSWKDLMRRTRDNSTIIACIQNTRQSRGSILRMDNNYFNEGGASEQDGAYDFSKELGTATLDSLVICNQLLDEIQKSLEEYLELKRSAFPRFCFLANDELLEILSQVRDPKAVQPHLSKCFDSVKSISFDDAQEKDDHIGNSAKRNQKLVITAMNSAEGEVVELSNPIPAIGAVENWLSAFEKEMRNTLYDRSKKAITEYDLTSEDAQIKRREWLFDNAAQCVLAVDQIAWTYNTTKSISNGTLQNHLDFTVSQINELIDIVRSNLTGLQRTLLGALIVLDVHCRDIVRSFIENGVNSCSEFLWTKQLRYYWDTEIENILVKQTNTKFDYAYEYLGNTPRLVITPLTDLCYMTLTLALHLRFGGAPSGPAGTGKTETTKDLAKALAVQIVVFNCSDGLDYKIMGRFFSGLAQCGAWSCFDEFNRIDIEVLSVIAQQVLTIQQGIIAGSTEIDFEGKHITLKDSFGVFITMNPGYAGRTELPDNLKALFRPVAMMVPDYRLIAEIILFSEGFTNALPLSNKMLQLYKLSSEQLSKQDHYDFGMRAVKSVLVAAGNLKRKEPDTNEDLLLIRAMRDSNVPKFLVDDLILFRGILTDLFPGIVVPNVDNAKLETAIQQEIEQEGLVPHQPFIEKVIQVHETQQVRHGLMLVGESGSGKTTSVRILAQAITALSEVVDEGANNISAFRAVKRMILNPKSISAGELYGEFDLLTGEWSDGIIPKLVRSCVVASNENNDRKWIIFDGPVDAVWIENMNTVLDDNKTLCLANSERIKVPNTVHMMFEVEDLAVASPATVSRCGMIYMEQVHVGLESLVRAWINHTNLKDLISENHVDRLISWILKHVPQGLKFLKENKRKIKTSDGHLMQSFLHTLSSLFRRSGLSSEQPMLERVIPMMFTFAYSWSLGGVLDEPERQMFNEFATKELALLLDGTGKMNNVFDYFVEPNSAAFLLWENTLNKFQFNPTSSYCNILVQTQDTTRYRYLLDLWIDNNRNVFYSGETGVGKSVIIQGFLDEICSTANDTNGSASRLELQSQNFVSGTLNFSAQTKPNSIVEMLETSLEKKRKTLLGPPTGKRMVVFIDDINMPRLEEYGAQPPNELLRQLIDQGGFYDTKKLFFKEVSDVSICAACAPAGGGRSELPRRLVRQFHTVWLAQLSSNSMFVIFSEILQGFMKISLPGLAHNAGIIVRESIQIFDTISKELLPTPSKSHYTFNLRDLSKVIQGMLMINPIDCEGKETLIQLWLHEMSRNFRDRLVCDEDRAWFDDICVKHLEGAFSIKWDKEYFNNCIFGDFETKDSINYKMLAKDANSTLKLADTLNEYLEEYNMSSSAQMNLVIFKDAIQHVSRICRVLRQPRGNVLLVGVGGSGRQSLARLSAFTSGYDTFSIEITRGFGVGEFHEFLKDILIRAGTKDEELVFLFSDTQIVYESFLEDINSLLNSGQIPNLFEPDEIEKIVSSVRQLAKQEGKPENRKFLLKYFVELVRENLHIVLAFSPAGNSFRNRCRMFPSLINCCTVDWFSAWPEDALFSVANFFLEKLGKEHQQISPYVSQLCSMCVKMHRSVRMMTSEYLNKMGRYNYTTPTSYLELIKLYETLLGSQTQMVTERLNKYSNGLKKLEETEQVVSKLQAELKELLPTLEQAKLDTSALLEQLEVDQQEADVARGIAQKDEAEAIQVEAEVNIIKEDCEADLAEALPAYHSAVKALDALDKKHIQEVKSFAQPPKMVAFTMEAVCILLQQKADWKTAKVLMADINFLQKLKDFDKDSIDPKTMKKVSKYVSDPEFTYEKVKNVSTAASSLCMWVHAIAIYDGVAKNIAPKKAKLAEAEINLERVRGELAQKKANLSAVEKKLASLKTQYDESLKHKEELEESASNTSLRLERAKKLIDGLSDEKIRWEDAKKTLELDLTNLVGDMMLASGCVSYLGPFTADFRSKLVSLWISISKSDETSEKPIIPVNPSFSLQSALTDPVEVRKWNFDGLPADEFSIQNGAFSKISRRWPLMIDPQSQANKWIRNSYAGRPQLLPNNDSEVSEETENTANQLEVLKLSDSNFLRTIENSVRFGKVVLLENVGESLDPSIEPILTKNLFKRGGQWLIRLGDTDVPYSEEFKFFMTTKLPNPHYMPEVMVKVIVINFTVTLSGLENQLLVDVVRNERPELESKKSQLVLSISEDLETLKEIENSILVMLANASGNILDDEELIEKLGESKATSQTIKSRMKESETTTKEINDARNEYRPIATEGSIIYFVIASLSQVENMYQYSLQFFQNLFVERIRSSETAEDVKSRLAILSKDIKESMFVKICRGLFEKDKVIFAFLLAVQLQKNRGVISEKELNVFLVGATVGTAMTESDINANKLDKPEWVNDRVWTEILSLEVSLPCFKSLKESILQSSKLDKDEWKCWAEAENVHKLPLPFKWQEKLTPFQRLLVIRAMRKERIIFASREFVGETLGNKFVQSPAFDLNAAFVDSTSVVPLIFILSPGADIKDYLIQIAESKNKSGPSLKMISLGQGQGPIAERLMEHGRVNGDWVCLQNCHLAASWLPTLEQIVENVSLDPVNVHNEYRLWLTSNPTPNFPVSILQNGIKITNEPPRGLRANICRTFQDMSEEEFENAGSDPKIWKTLLVGTVFYNALILERRKFGAIGWNIQYDWMNSDLKTALMQLRLYINEAGAVGGEIPFETLNVMVGDITYGGRITDAHDKQTNASILSKFFCEDAMRDDYILAEGKSGDGPFKYKPPPADASLVNVIDYMKALPADDHPQVFGLHGNADITLQQNETNKLIDTVIASLAGSASLSTSSNDSEGNTDLDSVDDDNGSGAESAIISQISNTVNQLRGMADFDARRAHELTFTKLEGTTNSLGVFLSQEMARFNLLKRVVVNSMDNLNKAIKGFVVMSTELEDMQNRILFQKVPIQWENAGYLSIKPLGSWIADFFLRLEFIESWLTQGPRPSYWIPGFFFPQGFMTSVLQSHARNTKQPVDLLSFETNILSQKYSTNENVTAPEIGSYIHGLFMQGARFDVTESKIVESAPSVLFDEQPMIHLVPVVASQKAPTSSDTHYSVPLYKTSVRAGTLSTTGHSTNFVVSLDYPTGEYDSSHWIRRGVALLCMLDD